MGDTSSIRYWLDRPLCRRYVTAVFGTSSVQLQDGSDRHRSVCWALGSLIGGELEVLGTWQIQIATTVPTPSVFGELQVRGAEFIRFGVGDFGGAESAFKETYRNGELIDSVEQLLESVVARVPRRHRLEVSNGLRAAAEAESLEAGRSELAGFQASRLGERYPEVVQRWREALARFEPIYSLNAQLRGLIRSADRTAADVRGRLARAIHRHGPFTDSAAALAFVAVTLARAEQRLDRERAAVVAAREAGVAASRRAAPKSGAAGVPALA